MMKPAVSIIIPNFNGAHLLGKNLPSVCRFCNQSPIETEIIVVDDASSDGSVELLRNEFKQVRTVVHEANQGFSSSVYSGIKVANFELLLLLNSDVQLVEDIISPLASYFSDADTFSVSPLIKNEHGDVDRHAWNLRYIKSGRLKLMNWRIEDALALRSQDKLPTCYASGGSMMVRKTMIEALGGFHPIFKPFYGEDFDLGLRAWSRGWPSYFEPAVQVIHQDKGAISETEKRRHIKTIQRRNRYLLEWIHIPRKRWFFTTLPNSIFQLLGELITFDFTNIKGFFLACGKLSAAREARAELERNRKLTLDSIIHRVCHQRR